MTDRLAQLWAEYPDPGNDPRDVGRISVIQERRGLLDAADYLRERGFFDAANVLLQRTEAWERFTAPVHAPPDKEALAIVQRIRSQQTRAAAARRLVFDYDDAAAAEMIAEVIATARRSERERIIADLRAGAAGSPAQLMLDFAADWMGRRYAVMVR